MNQKQKQRYTIERNLSSGSPFMVWDTINYYAVGYYDTVEYAERDCEYMNTSAAAERLGLATADTLSQVEPPANQRLVSSMRLQVIGQHAHVGVWVRGGKAGTLIVDVQDAEMIISKLAGPDTTVDR